MRRERHIMMELLMDVLWSCAPFLLAVLLVVGIVEVFSWLVEVF